MALLLLHRFRVRLLGPVLWHDLVRSTRRGWLFLLRTLYAAALGLLLGGLGLAWSAAFQASGGPPRALGMFLELGTGVLLGVQFVVAVLLTPLWTANVIAGEKERRTLEFLLATDLRNTEIVLGRLVARLAVLVLLLLTGLPAFFLAVFLGGVAAELVLAGFVVTLLTMVSLACLTVLCSVYAHRVATTVVLAYLAAAAYTGLSLAGLGLLVVLGDRDVVEALLALGIDPYPLRDGITRWNDVVGAGNLFFLLFHLGTAYARGIAPAAVLPGLLGDYAVFHLLVALACAAWAVARVRAVARQQAEDQAPRAWFWQRWLPRPGPARPSTARPAPARPPVGERPVLWKEMHVEGMRLPFARLTWMLLLLGVLVGPLGARALYAWEGMTYGQHRWIRPQELEEFLNVWTRGVSAALGFLLLLLVALRAAACLTSERARDTLDSLLLTRLDRDVLLRDKALGSILSVRKGMVCLATAWILGILTGGLHPLALPLLLVAWLVCAAFMAVLGLWFSVVCRSTLRALLATVVAMLVVSGAHWIAWLGYGAYFVLYGGGSDRNVEWLTAVHAALTPPGVLFLGGFQSLPTAPLRERELDDYAWQVMGFAAVGLVVWAAGTVYLWRRTVERFRTLTDPTAAASDDTLIAPVRPRWRRVLRLAAAALAATCLLGAVGWYTSGRVGERKLRAAIAEADALDPGWRLEELEARRVPVPEAENAAPRVAAVARLLSPEGGSVLPASAPLARRNQLTVDQVLGTTASEVELAAEYTAALSMALQPMRAALDEGAGLARLPRGRFAVALPEQRFTLVPAHLAEVARVSDFLLLAAVWRAQEQDWDGALTLVLAALNAARSVGDELSYHAQELRSVKGAQAMPVLERILAQGEPSAPVLAAAQQLLEDEAAQPLFLMAVRAERARLHALLQAIQAGEITASQALRRHDVEGQALNVLSAAAGTYAHGDTLALMTQVVETARQPPPWMPRGRDSLYQRYQEASLLAQELTRRCVFAAGAFQSNLGLLRCAVVAVACERYRRQERQWPEQLDALVPAYLVRVPDDPYDGKPLRYRRLADGVVVYTIGYDGTDNNGQLRQGPGPWRFRSWGSDEGLRLWDVGVRRQPPQPAAGKRPRS